MNWLGQHIVSLIARFKSSVYFENVENGDSDTDKFLIIGSSGKLKYRTGAEVASDIGASGDITGVTAGTGLSGGGTSGAVTLNVEASQTQITAIGTIATGTWQGTAIGASYVATLNQDTTGNAATVTSATGSADSDQEVLFTASGVGDTTVLQKSAFTFNPYTNILTVPAVYANVVSTTLSGTLATASQPNITGVGTIGTGVWNGTKVSSVYANTGGRRYGNILKILPQDFMKNDDSSGNALNYKDAANAGVQVDNNALEAIAFVAIPEGMKATHVDMYGSTTSAVKVIEEDITDSIAWSGGAPATDLAGGSGVMNTQIDLSSDVNSTADNMLAIKVTLTATSQRIYGGKVTIAPQ